MLTIDPSRLRNGGLRNLVVVASATLVAACTSSGSPAPSTEATTPAGSAPPSRSTIDALPLCADQPPPEGWRCGSVEVPIDRDDPDAGTIDLLFHVLPHQNGNATAGEPIFTLSGGPGYRGYTSATWSLVGPLSDEHDFVYVDPRGTGENGVLDCPDLQDGWADEAAMHRAVAACGKQLGDDADRYGSGDVALDLDAVRASLGYETIDLSGQSYGNVIAQGYVARFPERTHAIVLDAGMPVTDAEQAYWLGQDYPGATARIGQLLCDRTPGCKIDVAGTTAWLAKTVRTQPVHGEATGPHGEPTTVTVDEATLATLVSIGGPDGGILEPERIDEIATALRRDDPRPLLEATAAMPGSQGDQGDAFDYSAGVAAAAYCNDQDLAWRRTDPLRVRRQKFDGAVTAFPDPAFAPFSAQGWSEAFGGWARMCLTWPAPDRFEPAVPNGTVVTDIPTLMLSGDLDPVVPLEVNRRLLAFFPNATQVTVAGASHPVLEEAWAGCSIEIVTRFFDTLKVGDTSCASRESG